MVMAPKIGIIPARAGFTKTWAQATQKITDHPRSRGVYTVTDLVTIINLGSSPLARGLPRPRLH